MIVTEMRTILGPSLHHTLLAFRFITIRYNAPMIITVRLATLHFSFSLGASPVWNPNGWSDLENSAILD